MKGMLLLLRANQFLSFTVAKKQVPILNYFAPKKKLFKDEEEVGEEVLSKRSKTDD